MVEELKACIASAHDVEDTRQDCDVSRFLRDHGEALVEALKAEAKWKEMTDQARAVQHRHLGKHEGDVYHAMQYLASKYGYRSNKPMFTKAIDLARTKARAGESS